MEETISLALSDLFSARREEPDLAGAAGKEHVLAWLLWPHALEWSGVPRSPSNFLSGLQGHQEGPCVCICLPGWMWSKQGDPP